MLGATTWASLAGAYFPVLLLLIGVLLIASWKIFTKAGQPSWAVAAAFYLVFGLRECRVQ